MLEETKAPTDQGTRLRAHSLGAPRVGRASRPVCAFTLCSLAWRKGEGGPRRASLNGQPLSCPDWVGILTTDPRTHRTVMLVRLSPNVCQSKHLLQLANIHCMLPTAPAFVLVQQAYFADKCFKGKACVWPVESIAASESKGPRRKYPWHQLCGQLCEAGNGRLDMHSPRLFLAIDVCRGHFADCQGGLTTLTCGTRARL